MILCVPLRSQVVKSCSGVPPRWVHWFGTGWRRFWVGETTKSAAKVRVLGQEGRGVCDPVRPPEVSGGQIVLRGTPEVGALVWDQLGAVLGEGNHETCGQSPGVAWGAWSGV